MQNMDNKSRLYYVDFLKFLGLSLIVLAHVDPPQWVIMLRCFDVPLMVILSSLLAQKSYIKNKNIFNYYISRFKRLVLPTWIFLVIFFLIQYIISGELFDLRYYIDTFLLTRYGLGYVWIILIYLYSAILVPLFNKMEFNFKNSMLIIIIYIIYEICYYYKVGINYRFIETTFYYIIPYGLLTYIGFNYNKSTNKGKWVLTIVSMILFLLMGFYYYKVDGFFQIVQIAKYPARLYYLAYGIIVSILLLIICQKYNFKLFRNRIIIFISSHSMWIYLWHVLLIYIYKLLKLPQIWYLMFIIVYIGTILLVLIINKFIDIIEKKYQYSFWKYLR